MARFSLLTNSYIFDPITNNKKNVKTRAIVEVDDTSPSTPPSVLDENGEKFGQWLPQNNAWGANSEYSKSNIPNDPNGQPVDSYLFQNTEKLKLATSNIINSLSPQTAREFAKQSYSPGVIASDAFASDPAVGGGPGEVGIQSETLDTNNSDTKSKLSSSRGEILIYPIKNNDEEFDFLKITEFQYQPPQLSTIQSNRNFGSESTETRIKEYGGTVCLPMHPGISDSNSVGWGDDSLNPIQAAFGQVASNAIENVSNIRNANDVGNALKEIVEGSFDVIGTLGAEGSAGNYIKQYFAGQAVGANIVGRTTGLVLNPNLELLFTGPNLRTFSYSYKLTPRDSKESEKIKKIILFFKKAMAVQKSNTSLFLKTPSVFKLEYIYGKNGGQHPFLNKIKTCALTSFNVDYTPDGTYMTYNDDGSMTSYNISMSFSELEPIYREDYDDNLADMGF
jgi:hypothetical protein